MKTKTEIQIYEINGEETGVHYPVLKVKSHWNQYSSKIVLIFGKKEITVTVKDLERAIKAVTS